MIETFAIAITAALVLSLPTLFAIIYGHRFEGDDER